MQQYKEINIIITLKDKIYGANTFKVKQMFYMCGINVSVIWLADKRNLGRENS